MREDICGALFLNEEGELVTCVLNKHSGWSFSHDEDGVTTFADGHCDGVDRCEEYECSDPIEDVCHSMGLTDHNGVPTMRYYEEFA